ncbi:hypothetical protein HPB47_013610 [Ixodes persulcatus]|uniref:Uncharacterized protein n=1 Tax=Ixodes persulcatus TaxID=34615 RepID=A0AC60R0U0_IXOPE|nr:hypothetical protein HPB47_013610 [Ixodes persulcatus]
MFDKLESKYLCIEPSEAQKDYHGRANPELNEPITVWELEYELTKIKKTAAPAPDLLERPSCTQTRAVLALDPKGAFDNVTHKSVLQGLASIDCGLKTYDYIKIFLTDRTGAVLSPLLFNLALKGLPEILTTFPASNTPSTPTTSPSESLQRAANAVASYAKDCGLQCSPQKSELLVFKNTYNRQPPADLNILTQSGSNLSTINKLTTSTTHVVGMLRRIRNQRSGLKEKEAIELVYAFVVSWVMYATPYLRLTQTEVNKLNAIIQRAFKCALGLPEYVVTEDLLSTGLYNTIEELWEAQRISQIKRLSETPNGR